VVRGNVSPIWLAVGCPEHVASSVSLGRNTKICEADVTLTDIKRHTDATAASFQHNVRVSLHMQTYNPTCLYWGVLP
jgi:hypothetical protein